ncbi:MAG: diadenylate cyclase CdaA [Clostridia bacterium]|nr:diadenylate cyclase CdaA [Clostridia bacterium]
MTAIMDYFRYVWSQLQSIRVVDVLDILIVALIFYYIFQFMRKRRAGKLLMGILLLIVILLISQVAGMKGLNFILSNLFSVGILSMIILFQPELRSFLEKVGTTTSLRELRGRLESRTEDSSMRQVINEVAIAASRLSESKTGALIVFERNTKLGDVTKTGTVINADVSSYLLENIFFVKAPLHDGAVVIADGRIHSAGCYLPLSNSTEIIKDLGTRHRAGIGMSEDSDAVVLIVSEETGVISVAVEGELQRNFNKTTLESYLYQQLLTDTSRPKNVVGRVRSTFTKKGGQK